MNEANVAPESAEAAGGPGEAPERDSGPHVAARELPEKVTTPFLLGRAGEPRMSTCSTCGADFGPVTPFTWRGHEMVPQLCGACADRMKAGEAARRAVANRARLNLPTRPEYENASLDRFWAVTPSQKAALAAVSDMAADWSLSGRLPGGLMLCGPTGVGKTLLAVCLAIELGPDDCLFLSTYELLDAMRAGYNGGDASAVSRAADVPYLILDDISSVRVTEWVEERLYALLNTRWNAGLPLMTTSNVEPGELRARLGDGTASRIVGMCGRVIVVDGPDGRLGGKR